MLIVKDFWAEWCGPCRMMKPVIEKLAEKNTDVEFQFINVDEQAEATSKYGIRSIPTFILEKDGIVIEKRIGGLNEKEFQELINKHK